jgi:hypothetical protein
LPIQQDHERLKRGRVLTETLSGIEREKGHVPSGTAQEDAARNAVILIREQTLNGMGGGVGGKAAGIGFL